MEAGHVVDLMARASYPNGTHIPDAAHLEFPRYGYLPTFYVCILFIVLFGLSTLAHLVQALRSRLWFLIPTVVICGIGECVGWAGRLWSNQNIELKDPFLMQIVTTIIAPTFLSAANFVILGVVVSRLGREYSLITPKYYTIIFVGSDVAALVVQSVGGAQASSAETDEKADQGGRVMLGGIVIQLVALVVYVVVAGDFFRRYLQNKPFRAAEEQSSSSSDDMARKELAHGKSNRGKLTPRIQLMILSLGSSTLFLFIRGIYRTIELSDGWNGRIIATQIYFNVLDGAMIVLAMYTLNFLHPSFLLFNEDPTSTHPSA